jgi:hypothetical protein
LPLATEFRLVEVDLTELVSKWNKLNFFCY